MAEEGAAIVDVGGESTRPHAAPVDEEEELRRVLPVVAELARQLSGRARISIDTRSRKVAEAALASGATIINDVSASLWHVAAQRGAGWVAMHMRGEPADMMSRAHYVDVVVEVKAYLQERAHRAADGGVKEIWVDPGIGFAKRTAHNLALLRRLDELVATGWPVAIGISRKRFIGALASGSEDVPAPLQERLEGSLAGAIWAMVHGAAIVRVPRCESDCGRSKTRRDFGKRCPSMRGKWAAGIKPRFFTWVIKDKLAVCERPGGYARNHRKVRRREEILWIKCQGFTRVVSLLASPHNLHAYDEEKLAWSHVPFAANDDPATVLPDLYGQMRSWLQEGERVVLHQEELGDRLLGVVVGYLNWSGLINDGQRKPSPS